MKAFDGGDHLGQLSFDMLLLGELGPDDAPRAHRHLDMCGDCRARYDELQRDAEAFDQMRSPSERQRPEVGRVRLWPWSGRRLWGTATAVALAAAAVVLVLHPPGGSERARGDLLQKGTPTFTVFAKHGDRVFPLTDGARLEPHDALRFTADPARHRYLLVVSIDAAGQASVYFPYRGAKSGEIEANRRFEDRSAIQLDETRGPERLFALFSDRSLEATPVIAELARVARGGAESVRRAGRLSVPAEFQVSLLIEK